jgi:hypothetical protein
VFPFRFALLILLGIFPLSVSHLLRFFRYMLVLQPSFLLLAIHNTRIRTHPHSEITGTLCFSPLSSWPKRETGIHPLFASHCELTLTARNSLITLNLSALCLLADCKKLWQSPNLPTSLCLRSSMQTCIAPLPQKSVSRAARIAAGKKRFFRSQKTFSDCGRSVSCSADCKKNPGQARTSESLLTARNSGNPCTSLPNWRDEPSRWIML